MLVEGHVVGLPALILGHPYIFPAYRGCHLLAEETDRRTRRSVGTGRSQAHRGLPLLGCKKTDVSSTRRSQEVYHLSEVTAILHQCILD